MSTASGRERWLLAGQALLRSGGIATVKLENLTAETGLTTGSFYHHFANVDVFLDELARFFGAEQVEISLAATDDPDPLTRLSKLVRRNRDDDMTTLYAAMRIWAGSSSAAEKAVRAADHRMLEFLESAFADLGHDQDSARLRALLFMSAGVARIHPPWRLPRDLNHQMLALLAPS